jgi:hypothetical protein
MRTNFLVTLALASLGINAQNTTVDLCPKTEHACLDVINSSLCLSQNAALGTNGTKDAMAACVTFAQGASNITGAAKVYRRLDEA